MMFLLGSVFMADDPVHDRAAAWALLTEWTQSEPLRRHALAVEASVRAYARSFGEDEEAWGNVALLHDFDYERHPTLDSHPQDGAPVLREHGYPEWFVRAVQSHGDHTGVIRESRLEHTLYACDEVSGFVHACGLVRPDGIATLEARSVRKKLKQPSFAKGVNRDDVVRGAQELGVDLDEHITFVIEALRPISGELGLRR
jgi:putative nucleotidyltransferase with HDIG domain